MPVRRRTSQLLLLLTAILGGWFLLTVPGSLVQQYQAAAQIGPVVAWVYLSAVILGALLLLTAGGYLAWRLLAGAWRRRLRGRAPEQLSAAQKREVIAQNLAETARLLAEEGVPADDRAAMLRELEGLQAKQQDQRLEIVAFGTISSGKSSLLNSLAGTEVFPTDPRGGTTTRRGEMTLPGEGRVLLVDTPGLGEVGGGDHADLARRCARDADIVLFVVDGPLKSFEHETLAALAAMGKRILLCLNKADWYPPAEQASLLAQLRPQVAGLVAEGDVIVVRSRPASRSRVRELADGSTREETVEVPPDLSGLADRLLDVVRGQGGELLLVLKQASFQRR